MLRLLCQHALVSRQNQRLAYRQHKGGRTPPPSTSQARPLVDAALAPPPWWLDRPPAGVLAGSTDPWLKRLALASPLWQLLLCRLYRSSHQTRGLPDPPGTLDRQPRPAPPRLSPTPNHLLRPQPDLPHAPQPQPPTHRERLANRLPSWCYLIAAAAASRKAHIRRTIGSPGIPFSSISPLISICRAGAASKYSLLILSSSTL